MDSQAVAKNGIYKCTECKQLKNQYDVPSKVPEVEIRDGKVVGNPDDGHFCKPEFPGYPGPLM